MNQTEKKEAEKIESTDEEKIELSDTELSKIIGGGPLAPKRK